MAELNYLNPASLLPSTQEMAGGEFASPFARAFQAGIAANRAVPFLQQALTMGDIGVQSAQHELEEAQSPLAKSFREQKYRSGINELLMKEKEAKLRQVNMEALDLYPVASKALKLINDGDTEGAKTLYETYTSQRGDQVPPELKGFGPNALKVMEFAKTQVESNPELVQKLALQAPEITSRERTAEKVANISANSAVKVAEIHKEASLAGIQAQLDKTDAGQFSRVVEKLNNGQNLDAGDRLLLSSKVTDQFSKSPGGKLVAQLSSLLLISGIKDTGKAMELLSEVTKESWQGFIKNLPEGAQKYLKDEVPDIKTLPQQPQEAVPTTPTTGAKDLGPATGYAEGVTGKKGGVPVVVRNGRFVPINE